MSILAHSYRKLSVKHIRRGVTSRVRDTISTLHSNITDATI
jgi:hypothetical protein